MSGVRLTKQAFNNNTLKHFNETIYHDVISHEMLLGHEIGVDFGDGEGRIPGFLFKKDLKTYFVRSEDVEKLPARVSKSFRVMQGNNVYHGVTGLSTVNIKPNKELTFRELIDGFCNFEHTNQTHFTLWKITSIAAYLNRVNYRLATPPAFGKDSVQDAKNSLTNSAVRIDNATFAKLEYVLKYDDIMCNEVASLKPEELKDFESFGLSAGAFQNIYTKRSRRSHGTKERYDISSLSLGFTYNTADCYEGVGYKKFDELFTKQFLDRFLPLRMEGVLKVGQFRKEGEIDFKEECKSNMDFYKAFLKTLYWYLHNPPKYRYELINFAFPKNNGRHLRSFNTICLYISEYCNTQKEYSMMCSELFKCYKAYIEKEIGKPITEDGKLLVKEEYVK